ncbi:hypothetical protein MY04_0435 [Flammeovirga sp. MY04]|uniref:hypothetical protein n=1 Tax=Flammeovirga sp. MY04 TaxID=1191459 RepID=UPI0008063742|nr:hypothetical protein [Flammeovirga sp. MY04]ANQ47817.1 hypothetical protein MY04_0435 [Flammeovirga sp. MY04]
MKKLSLFYLLFCLLLYPKISKSQSLDLGIGGSGFIPTGTLAQNISSNYSCGLALDLHYSFPKSSFTVGVNFDYILTDQKALYNLPRVKEYKSVSNIYNLNFLFRVSSKKGLLRPYADALLGIRGAHTKGNFNFDSFFNHSDKHENIKMNNEIFLGYGIGGGIGVYPNQNFGILIGCNYMGSSDLPYINEENITTRSNSGWDKLLQEGFDSYAQTIQASYFNPYVKLNFTIIN